MAALTRRRPVFSR